MIILIIFSAYVMVYGFDIFYDSFLRGRTTGSLLNLPSWIAELSVPFCFLLLLIQSFLEIIKLLKHIEPPESDH
jgi:TRAP-type C4-dicarboxylate transport system permease small subunit